MFRFFRQTPTSELLTFTIIDVFFKTCPDEAFLSELMVDPLESDLGFSSIVSPLDSKSSAFGFRLADVDLVLRRAFRAAARD